MPTRCRISTGDVGLQLASAHKAQTTATSAAKRGTREGLPITAVVRGSLEFFNVFLGFR